jgi:hypothetical protein
MKKKTLLLALPALLMCAHLAYGQVTAGELMGYVYDQQGAVIVGAQVTISSPVLMGDRTTETSDKGLYRFVSLPPGEYIIKVSKESYKQYEQKGITISAGKASGLDITLEVGEFEAVITVIGDAPLIDVQSSQQKINITGELQRALPTTIRSNFSEVLRVSPGATLNDPNRPQYSYYSVGGASPYYENNWTMDGARMNQWEYSYMSTRINLDAVEDVEIGLAGANATSPLGQGGTVHLMTKSGGNEFHGAATFRYQPTRWNDNNIEGGTAADNEFTEYGFSLGGYAIKDKLWFFGAGRITKIDEGLSRTPETIAKATAAYPSFSAKPIDKNMKDLFIKGTYMHSDKHQFTFGYQRDWGYETFAFAQWDPSAYIDEGTVGPMYNGTWNWFVNDNLNVFTQVSFFDKNRDRFGRTRDQSFKIVYEDTYLSGGLIYGLSPIVYYGNYAMEFQVAESMVNITSTASYFLDDFYGSHDIKIGFFASPAMKNQFKNFAPTKPLRQYYALSDPSNPASQQILFYQQTWDRDVQEYPQTIGKDYALFFNDTWRPNTRMTIEAGLRVDFISQSEELFDVKASDYIATTAISPNIGLNYALTEDRKNILRASYSLRHQNYTAYTFPTSNLGIQHGYTAEYDTDLNGTLETIVRVPEVVRDPDPKSLFDDVSLGYSHDIVLGYSRELPYNSTISFDYTYRQFRNMLTEYNINPIIENGVFVGVIDPTRPNGEWWTYKNDKWNWKEYQSFSATYSRVASPLTVLASILYEHGALRGTWSPYDWDGYLTPDKFDNYSDAGGAWGGGDRGLTYRVNLTYLAPWGIHLAAQIMGQSGPRSGYLYEYLSASDPSRGPAWLLQDGYWVYNPLSTTQRIVGQNRKDGQWRSSMVHVVNIRFGKEFRIMDQGVELTFDVFNLFNSATSLQPDSRGNYDSSYYGDDSPYDLLSARSAQMMIRYTF